MQETDLIYKKQTPKEMQEGELKLFYNQKYYSFLK